MESLQQLNDIEEQKNQNLFCHSKQFELASKQYQYEQEFRHKRAVDAIDTQKDRFQNPQGDAQYPEENFIEFFVQQSKQKIRLATYRYQPNKQTFKKPLGVIIFMHGINGHSGQGAHIAQYSSERGFVCLAFDQRGYGQSEGLKAYIQTMNCTVGDMKEFIFKVKELYPQQQLFIFCYSLGGYYTFRLCLEAPDIVSAVVFFSPALLHNQSFNTWGKRLAQWLTPLFPKWVTPVQSGRSSASKNPTVNEDLKQDKLIYHAGLRPGTMHNVISAINDTEKDFHKFKTPYLMVSGGLDQIVDPDLAFEFWERSSSHDKDFLFYENMWHDCWHEQEVYEFIPQCLDWVVKRVK